MSDMDIDMTLWCLLKGEKAPFPVAASPTTSIAMLKKLIKREQENAFRKVDAYELQLWKVNVDLDGIRGAISKGKYQFKAADDEGPLWDADTLLKLWPSRSFSRDQLHIYITLPAKMGSPSLVQMPASQDGSPRQRTEHLWLREVHSKIWKQEELGRRLFCEVKITQADYDTLQERLREQHPDRDSPEYDGRMCNVRSVKLDVLRSIQGEVGDYDDPEASDEDGSNMDVDGQGANNEDGSGTNSPFPFILRFLDLTILNLKNVPRRLPSPLFLRREYDKISELIERQPQNKYGSVIVSGQPGTGKTSYLYLRVIQFMIKGRPFLFQATQGIVHRVDEKGVQVISSWPSNENIVAFVDNDKNNFEPDDILLDDEVQLILASSPKGTSSKWIKQANYDVMIIATYLWSRVELLITGIFLYPLDISPELLQESTSYFGYNPRLCFTSARSVDQLDRMKKDVLSRITSIDYNSNNMLQLVNSARTGDATISHSIFEIYPKNNSRLLTECEFRRVSPWVFDHFMKTYKDFETHRAMTFYHDISRSPRAAALWGYVFENLVLNTLDGIGTDDARPFEIRRLTSGVTLPPLPWWYLHARRVDFLQEEDFVREITQAVTNNERLHLVPLSPTFPAADSILYAPNDVLTCIQTTVSSKHPINTNGLRQIQKWLKDREELKHLCPSASTPWRFIFIVPPDNASGFEWQKLERDTARGEWDRKTHQYVLGLDVLENEQHDV